MGIAFNTVFLVNNDEQRELVLTSKDSIYSFNGETWRIIGGGTTDTGPVDDGIDARWTGGWLTGSLTLANQQVVRTYQPGLDDLTQPMVYNGGAGAGDETWESLGYSARVFRPFREYMLAANISEGFSRYPYRVSWCDAVQPGQVPNDWVPTAENDAGDVDRGDTPGHIVDMVPLRDKMLIYKEDAIHVCEWIGGNDVFSFRTLVNSQGAYTRDCIAEYNGFHWVQGIDDLYVFDGNTATSIIWGRAKKWWCVNRDPDRAIRNWVVLDPVNEEALFGFVSKDAPLTYLYPDKALVLNLRNNSWTVRDYAMEMPHALVSLDVVNQASANRVFYGLDRTGSRILDLEAAPDRLGAAVPAYIERTGLFADPGHDFVQLDEAKLTMTGQDATLKMGNQLAIDAPITWREDFAFDPVTDYKTDCRQNGNLLAYRVDVSTLSEWQIASLMLKVQKAGERG